MKRLKGNTKRYGAQAAGLGMPIYGQKNEFGNLFAKIVIQMPNHLNDQEIDLFRKLAAQRK